MYNSHFSLLFTWLVHTAFSIPNFNELKDFHEIVRRQTRTGCNNSQFPCKSGECIGLSDVCDGVKDCKDGSDETVNVCGDINCPAYNFRCEYGACISSTLKCNGRADCADKSDETKILCPLSIVKPNVTKHCKSDEFQCKSGNCISDDLLCNGIKNCDDGSDESFSQCESVQCPRLRFRCDYGACIEAEARCNGIRDCPDGSDESAKYCKTPVPSVTPTSVTKPTKATSPSPVTVSSVDGCDIPATIDKSIVINDKDGNKLNIKQGSKAPLFTKLIGTCNPRYALEGLRKAFESICYTKGEWNPPLQTCIKTCKPLAALNIEFKCQRNGLEVGCEGEQLVGTEIRPICAPLFQPKTDPYYTKITCQPNGEWDQPLFTCIAECGLQSSKNLIYGGVSEMYGDSPWHVAIYRIPSDYLLICGGTLIHERIILSAAHCFYDEARDAPLNNTNEYEIYVSKITRKYENKDKDSQKKYRIKKLLYSEKGYNPINSGHHGSDIIMIILEKSVILSQYVLPACLATAESTSGFNPGENVYGKLSGWGLDKNNLPSEILLTAQLPYVSYDKCVKKQTHLTYDKFCAGGDTGPGAKVGDSGGGLLFRNSKNGLFYLRGIVSTAARYVNTSIATFTDISYFMDWIVKMRNEIDKEILQMHSSLGSKT